MAPTPLTSPSPLGLAILPRTACHNLHGCGSIPKDKLPLIITVAVVAVFIVVAILCCSFRSRGVKKQNPSIKDVELAPNTAPHAVRRPAPTLTLGQAGTGAGAGAGAGGATGTGTGTGAGAGTAGTGPGAATAAGAGAETTTWRVPEGGLPPLVPPPMYEETQPPPTYQRGAGPPVRRGEMAPRYT